MSEIPINLFQLSVSLIALAAKANQDGIVQQQIETMGLRQWLSLVSALLVERAYSEVAILRDFGGAVFRQKPVMAGANNTALSLLNLNRVRSAASIGYPPARYVCFVIVNRAHEIEFNVLNPYLIVRACLRLIFDRDGKRMPKARTKSSQPRIRERTMRQRQLRRSKMKMLSKMFVIAGLAAFVPAPVFAQSTDLIKQGDYYAPTQTDAQHATPQELNEFKQGDYYAPSNTVVQQPTAQELEQARQGDFYAPAAGE